MNNNKPIELVVEDTKQGIARAINNCGLPPFVIRYLLQDLLNEMIALEKQQYQIVKEKYENESKENTEVES